ncbi:hypothetical protein PLICRDRAFT_345338 [Plicaturopsis crispa FD-325 SS-3]|uniref:Uncharacterized protein n=1 Tax=Plicaturopsis crispa FD-325 SS-3 TaxID=944288 RepID=A0A0C9SRP5_PLICR|nr:hypothetical protein PLICRDRAFT_345338 [Plicaturopsis crispa FD-325 SS-3]
MSDLTVLVSPSPLYTPPRPRSPLSLSFASRRSSPNLNIDVSHPVMVTLESAPDSPPDLSSASPSVRRRDPGLLSPPRNTYKATRVQPPPRPSSAPPYNDNPISDLASKSDTSLLVSPPPRAKFNRRRTTSFAASRTGEPARPPPPVFRPTTFWRKTRRSGVTGAAYSPSSHVIRRSAFVAAGLSLDRPQSDLSALCVESRVKVICLPSAGEE